MLTSDKGSTGRSNAISSEVDNYQSDNSCGTLRPIVEDDFEMIDGTTEGADFGVRPRAALLETPSGFISGSTRGTTMAQLDNQDEDQSIKIEPADGVSYNGANEDEVNEMCMR